MKLWQIYVFLEKTKQFHNCKQCGKQTEWYLTPRLNPNTNTKHIEWWCSVCEDTYHEYVGPFVPN